MRSLVTGGAGFIGSHLCDALVERGWPVWCIDNLHLGREENVSQLAGNPLFRFVKMDVLDEAGLDALFREARFEAVFHLAANSDIAAGIADVTLDRRLNFDTTVSVLEAMRTHGVRDLFFASTSAVFGELDGALAEDAGPMRPISFYGASKLAAEAYVSVYVAQHRTRARVLRFPNVVGSRMTHGAVFDFVGRLRKDPSKLRVLGDGTQSKPYMLVSDLVRAILVAWDGAAEPMAVFHVGNSDACSVAEIAHIVLEEMQLGDGLIEYTGGDRGWPGDVPRFSYDMSRLESLGFSVTVSSRAAVRMAARWLARPEEESNTWRG
jgi:UDP-glucose 4-epimerase